MQKILSKMRKCIEKYNLIEENDKIAIGVSGGKDSLALLTALKMLHRFYPKKFDLVAICVDLFNGQSDFSKVKDYCELLNVELHIVPSNIYEIVFEDRKEKNPCSLCANLRRGILNSKARELACNKVALGHHFDDLIETFFLSMFYEGRLSTFSPKSYLSKQNLTVIRPLILIEESEIVRVSKSMPVFNNCCPANHKTKREYIKNLLNDIKTDIPFVKKRIHSAITEPERYNLFDKIK